VRVGGSACGGDNAGRRDNGMSRGTRRGSFTLARRQDLWRRARDTSASTSTQTPVATSELGAIGYGAEVTQLGVIAYGAEERVQKYI
jgi:hypothetical protein